MVVLSILVKIKFYVSDIYDGIKLYCIIALYSLRRKAMKSTGNLILLVMLFAAISGARSIAVENNVYQLGEVLVTANREHGCQERYGGHEKYSWLCHF